MTEEQNNITSSTTGSISYYGNVKITVKDGNTVISKKYYKNTGGQNLFKFLALCLAGDYAGAKNMAPAKIALYHSSDLEAPKEGNIKLVSSVISNDMTPVIKKLTDEAGYTVTYHFSVPYSKIMVNNTEINQVLLFSSNATASTASPASAASSYCAYYNIADTDSDDTNGVQGITPSDYSSNFNLVVEWALTVKNGKTN